MKRRIKLIALLFPVLSCVSCESNRDYYAYVDCFIETYSRGTPMRYFLYEGKNPYSSTVNLPVYMTGSEFWSSSFSLQAGDCFELTLTLTKEQYEKKAWVARYDSAPATVFIDRHVTAVRKKEIELHTVTYVSNEDYDLVSTVDGSVVKTPLSSCEEEDRSQCRYVFGAHAYGKPIDHYDVGTSFDIVTTPLLPGILLGTRGNK